MRIRIGSRDSQLAIKQTEIIMEGIQKNHPELELELITMKTTGDKILDRRLDQIGGKGLFVKELDQALLDGKIDLSVHSLKDLPMEKRFPLLDLQNEKIQEIVSYINNAIMKKYRNFVIQLFIRLVHPVAVGSFK